MPRTANKSRGEVALPESFGKGVFIRFTVDAMERLETEYGEDWVEIIIERTGKTNLSVFKKILDNTIVDEASGYDSDALSGAASEARVAILDALFLAIHGRTVEEQSEQEEKERLEGVSKKLEEMGEDPQMASALIFLQSLGGLGTAQDSAPTKSDASPQEKSQDTPKTGAKNTGS